MNVAPIAETALIMAAVLGLSTNLLVLWHAYLDEVDCRELKLNGARAFVLRSRSIHTVLKLVAQALLIATGVLLLFSLNDDLTAELALLGAVLVLAGAGLYELHVRIVLWRSIARKYQTAVLDTTAGGNV